MEIISNFLTVFSNSFIVLLFYIQVNFWYILLFALFATIAGIEYHEKDFLFVNDERKVI